MNLKQIEHQKFQKYEVKQISKQIKKKKKLTQILDLYAKIPITASRTKILHRYVRDLLRTEDKKTNQNLKMFLKLRIFISKREKKLFSSRLQRKALQKFKIKKRENKEDQERNQN